MLAETWYSADEAVAAGLADRVEAAQPAAENSFDLGVFTYAGRAKAPAPQKAQAPESEPEPDDRMEIRHRINARKVRAHS
jgi:hypothetical protein